MRARTLVLLTLPVGLFVLTATACGDDTVSGDEVGDTGTDSSGTSSDSSDPPCARRWR